MTVMIVLHAVSFFVGVFVGSIIWHILKDRKQESKNERMPRSS